MICHEFHNWWVIRHEDSLITHGPTDVGRSWKFFRNSWATRRRFGNNSLNATVKHERYLTGNIYKTWKEMFPNMFPEIFPKYGIICLQRHFRDTEAYVSGDMMSTTQNHLSPETFPKHGHNCLQRQFRNTERCFSADISEAWKHTTPETSPRHGNISLWRHFRDTET